jgi:putative transposase
MILTYKYKLLPTKEQHRKLEMMLNLTRSLYNAALEERISAYKNGKIHISKIDQFKSLTIIREDKELGYSELPACLGRFPLEKVDEAMKGFFSRAKKKAGKAGFPRFRSKSRFKTFGLTEWNGVRIEGKKLYIKGMGRGFRINMHRSLPDGVRAPLKKKPSETQEEFQVRQENDKSPKFVGCSVSQEGDKWFVCIQISMPDVEKVEETEETRRAFDWGRENTFTSDRGETIPTVRIGKRYAKKIRRLRRVVARCVKGSNGRKESVKTLGRATRKEANARNTLTHQTACKVVDIAPYTALEKLKVKNMTKSARGTVDKPGKNVKQKSGLNRSILDGAPAKLRKYVSYKAERAGGEGKEFDPRYTSQDCANCKKRVKKTLKERQYECDCGWNVHRDVNAACNGYKRSFRCDAPLVCDFRNRGVVTPRDGPIRLNHPDGDLNHLQGVVVPEASVSN